MRADEGRKSDHLRHSRYNNNLPGADTQHCGPAASGVIGSSRRSAAYPLVGRLGLLLSPLLVVLKNAPLKIDQITAPLPALVGRRTRDRCSSRTADRAPEAKTRAAAVLGVPLSPSQRRNDMKSHAKGLSAGARYSAGGKTDITSHEPDLGSREGLLTGLKGPVEDPMSDRAASTC
jgi:hypothetical protein